MPRVVPRACYSALSRLRFAIGCYWATQIIAFEYRPSRFLVANAAVGKGSGLPHALGKLSRRSSTFLLVAAFHAALFYLVVNTVSHTHLHVTPAPLVNRVLESPRPVPLPRPADPAWPKTTLEISRPVVKIPPERDVSPDVIDDTRETPSRPEDQPQVVQTLTHRSVIVQGGPGIGFPNPDEFYPSYAKHMGEQGSATLQVCVDGRGQLTTAPVITHSSGNDRLDQGAMKLAEAASGHYRASTEDGRPVSACYPLRVRFQIKN